MKMILSEKTSQNKNTLTGQVKAFLKKAGITDVDPAKFAMAFKSETPSARNNEILAKVLRAILNPKNANDVVNALPLLKRAIQKLKSTEADVDSSELQGGEPAQGSQQPSPIPPEAGVSGAQSGQSSGGNKKEIDQEKKNLLKQYVKEFFGGDTKKFTDAMKSQGLIESKKTGQNFVTKKQIIDMIKKHQRLQK